MFKTKEKNELDEMTHLIRQLSESEQRLDIYLCSSEGMEHTLKAMINEFASDHCVGCPDSSWEFMGRKEALRIIVDILNKLQEDLSFGEHYKITITFPKAKKTK